MKDREDGVKGRGWEEEGRKGEEGREDDPLHHDNDAQRLYLHVLLKVAFEENVLGSTRVDERHDRDSTPTILDEDERRRRRCHTLRAYIPLPVRTHSAQRPKRLSVLLTPSPQRRKRATHILLKHRALQQQRPPATAPSKPDAVQKSAPADGDAGDEFEGDGCCEASVVSMGIMIQERDEEIVLGSTLTTRVARRRTLRVDDDVVAPGARAFLYTRPPSL
ncbi:hypothetical protein C8R46DRAFT_1208981 [Mycena filopes]|nr:hypothetical protein C8R46DRAFT_1208981 [Mycena filopes]